MRLISRFLCAFIRIDIFRFSQLVITSLRFFKSINMSSKIKTLLLIKILISKLLITCISTIIILLTSCLVTLLSKKNLMVTNLLLLTIFLSIS